MGQGKLGKGRGEKGVNGGVRKLGGWLEERRNVSSYGGGKGVRKIWMRYKRMKRVVKRMVRGTKK